MQYSMAKRVCVDGEDRISELPVHIIHQILCCTKLNVREAARSCILSKRWYYCWTSRPNLIFYQFQGKKYMPLENYVKLVDQSLRSHVEQKLHLEQFILMYRETKLDSHVDTWIELAFKLKVRVLEINASSLRPYSLPDVIYDAKKLTILQLRKCKFEFDISTTPIRFDCLEDLYLHCVSISDAQLQRIINRSPFIRNLSLVDCRGINKLQVCGPVHLENLIVVDCKFYSVILQAPNLQCFKYEEHTDHQQFRDVSYKFPNILELDLTWCFNLKNIEIQSEKLKRLTLVGLKSLEKVTIQASNLLEFDYYGDKMPVPSMNPSSLERSQLNFFSTSTNFGSVDRSWYINIHHFVQKFNYSKGLMLVIFCRKTNNILIYENPREIVIPPSNDIEIFIAPLLDVESIIRKLMINNPKIMSILPCTKSKALQVLSALKRCTQKQKCGKECPFNTELFHNHHKLKEVSSCTGAVEEGTASIWYSWLKSTSLIDQATNLMLTWEFRIQS
ncbi:hypothetical protein H5410_062562 [Solanum commersonii]|uniref:F-box/LRR-repeat protein 15/At3g58940/PEG3-like LRR domain-containing protein n=1 Tax=Solanum commersonii TaxID=4109 RepID=A0A9J5WBW5_SOLCO|nr:hypothetical protein H5410_062562 [Solanum commersonii]